MMGDVGKDIEREKKNKKKKDTWLLKGIVPIPLFILVRFFNINSLNFLRLQGL